jgi:serine protease Do
MISLNGARSARRLALLATGASFAAAALLFGPGVSGQSMLPTVPTANAKETASQASRGWIGVQIQPVTGNIAESLGMKDEKGALVAEPLKDSPAAKAGILAGDVITALNGEAVKDARDLAKQVGEMAPGSTVKLTIWRKGEDKAFSLTLGEMPKQNEARAEAPKADANKAAADKDADKAETPKLGLMLAAAVHVAGGGSEGVIVVDLDQGGPAFEHGFKVGDIILDVGGKKVTTPVDVRNALRDAHKDGKRVVLMRLKSDETTKFVAVPFARA